MSRKSSEEPYFFPAKPEYWGPGFWLALHQTALKIKDVRIGIDLIKSLFAAIPCQKCRTHAQKYLHKHPLERIPLNNRELFRWTYEFHNEANKFLKKPILDFNTCLNIYLNKEICSDCGNSDDDSGDDIISYTVYRPGNVEDF